MRPIFAARYDTANTGLHRRSLRADSQCQCLTDHCRGHRRHVALLVLPRRCAVRAQPPRRDAPHGYLS